MFFDKAAKRAILSQMVKCSNWKRKCDWSGELSSLEVYIQISLRKLRGFTTTRFNIFEFLTHEFSDGLTDQSDFK